MIEPGLRKFITLHVELAPVIDMGVARTGYRKIIPIIGGSVEGEISGRILNLGADWQIVHSDRLAYLDARYAIETDEGAIIEIHNRGYRHASAEVAQLLVAGENVKPSEYYFRTAAFLETAEPAYDWVNARVFIGSGCRAPSEVIIDLYIVE